MLAEHVGRTVRIRALPIGIPFAHFETMAKMAPAKALSHGNIKIILGVDRLDYTKGSIYIRRSPRYINLCILLLVKSFSDEESIFNLS